VTDCCQIFIFLLIFVNMAPKMSFIFIFVSLCWSQVIDWWA